MGMARSRCWSPTSWVRPTVSTALTAARERSFRSGSSTSPISRWSGAADLVDDPSKVRTYDTGSSSYVSGTTAWQRFCSADLAAQSAYYNPTSGLGTQVMLFTSGEETSGSGGNNQGRGFAFEVDGANAGRATELQKLGNIAYENILASPFAQDKTVVFNMDDAARSFSSNASDAPSQLYVYVGTRPRQATRRWPPA